MSSTYRRIGDEIYKSFKANEKIKKNDEMTRTYPAIFLESDDAQIRFLSCLIILRTLKQGIFILLILNLIQKVIFILQIKLS